MVHPFDQSTVIRQWPKGQVLDIGRAVTGILGFGSTGSGKTSALLKHILSGYADAKFGFCILTAKPGDAAFYVALFTAAGRARDIILFDSSGRYCFNFMA